MTDISSVSAPTAFPPSKSSSTTQQTSQTQGSFNFPPYHSFPPLYTPQPNPTTEHARLSKWTTLILRYCRAHRLFRITIHSLLNSPLCHNHTISRRLSRSDLVHILDHLVKSGRAEWLGSAARSGKKKESTGEEGKEAAYIYWLTPEEWSQAVYTYVDETAQKNVVLTVYELIEGEGAEKHEWYGMDGEMFGRCLGVLVKRGKAQVFGSEEEAGVKFF